jgi:hypothetical protein
MSKAIITSGFHDNIARALYCVSALSSAFKSSKLLKAVLTASMEGGVSI